MQRQWLILFVGWIAMWSSGCGGSEGSGGLSDAAAIAVTGVSVDEDFMVNGEFTVGFVAEDANGDPLLATESATAALVSVKMHGNWKSATTKANGSVNCTVSTPDVTTCTLDAVTSTRPTQGAGNVAGSVLIDDSGSMSDSDPDGDRGPAANTFLGSVCTTESNMFGAFDFGAGRNLSFSDTRDLMTANGALDEDLEGSESVLPFAACTSNNLIIAAEAIATQIQASGGTPLWESVLELCTEMVSKNAPDEQLADRALAMLVLSDGVPSSDVNREEAEQCVREAGITTCTVGLGPGSELACSCTSDEDCIDSGLGDVCAEGTCGTSSRTCVEGADCFGTPCLAGGICQSTACPGDPEAIDALKSLAQAGSCVYAAATSAAALEPIFTAVGTAISTGQNFAEAAVTPIPASGTTVAGTLTVGAATATFSFVTP